MTLLRYVAATEADRDWFLALNRRCYEAVVTRQLGPWDDAAQRERFLEKWASQRFRKIYAGNDLVGGIWIDEHEGALQVREIQVDPDFQGLGYGTEALLAVIARARAEKLQLWLRVLHENEAIPLYERLGFEVTGRTETQFIMTLQA